MRAAILTELNAPLVVADLEPPAQLRPDRHGTAAPEQAVVAEHEAGPGRRGALEQLAVRGDAGGHELHVVAAPHLEPVRTVVFPPRSVEEIVEEGDQLVTACHAPNVTALNA